MSRSSDFDDIQNSSNFPKSPLAMSISQKIPKEKNIKIKSFKNKKKGHVDPVQIVLTAAIFLFLGVSMFYVLGPISMVAMLVGGTLSTYHMLSSRSNMFSANREGRRGPSILLIVIIGSPFLMGGLVAYEGFSLAESPQRIILLWAMIISFWTTMLFVPMSVISKHKETTQPSLSHFPKVSIIIPAYNEEKVIQKTLESMIETQYPRKEIIFVDDGSTDKTLEIAKNYKDSIIVLHKENGGKASALNYGMVYAKGEIIVVVDADTIIGRNSIKEIVKGFEVDKHVAAVAGNIKVRNRVNWITKCQALEYLLGIQVVRRAFDRFGSITVVPGALGAFKKSAVSGTGAYGKETIVEDFDQTIKLLKAGLITQGSIKAVAYTEAPTTVLDFAKQRKRWYRGNIQVLSRHSDALTNPRFGYLQKLALPYLFLGMIITPIIGFTALANVIIGVFSGDAWWVLEVAGIFTILHYMMSYLAIRIDEEDPKLMVYAGFLLFGFKQIVDFLLLKAIFEQLLGKKAKWTSARRIGDFNE
ncbi:MAG: glycosyltransferase [Nitrosopumilaceae archaeon]|nr:glycosyltransferase [Nitrosopumilaceae archaeon]